MPKASDAEIECRIETVVGLILEGKTRTNILRHFANLSERSVDYALKEAWRRIREANDGSREDKVTRHLQRYDAIALRAIVKGDLHAEIKARDSQAKILGLEIAPAEQAQRLEVPDDALDQVIAQESVH